MKLDTNNYVRVKATHILASHASGKVGSLRLNACIDGNNVTYEVEHNGEIKFKTASSVVAAQTYNDVLDNPALGE